MCFSATASFTVAAVLAPVGIYCLAVARRSDPSWLALAAYPLSFSVQQFVEGVLWLALASENAPLVAIFSRSFLFFSHFFWLAWVPFSVFLIETNPLRRQLLGILALLAGAFGLSISLPSLLLDDWLAVEVVRNSLNYRTTLIYDGWLDRDVLRATYAIVIVSALMIPADWRIRTFGVLIAASLLVTFAYYAYAYISVWCFFAAILSVYLVFVVRNLQPRAIPD
jgi:Family of unknown function (DUF6629)